jgi:hypothetical protein
MFLKIIKPISEEGLKLFLFNKEKRSIYKYNKYLDTNDLDSIINARIVFKNNMELTKVINKFNFSIGHYTFTLLANNLITFSKANFIDYYIRLNIELFHSINSEKERESFFKRLVIRINESIIHSTVLKLLNNNDNNNPIEVLKILVFVGFFVNIGLVNYTEIQNKFEELLVTNSSFLMFNLNDNSYLSHYIILTRYFYLKNIERRDLLYLIVDCVVISQIRDLNILYKVLKLYNTIFSHMPHLLEDEIFVDRYLQFVRFINKSITKQYYTVLIDNIRQSYKRDYVAQTYKVDMLNCIQMLSESPVANDINYKQFYIDYIPRYIEMLLYLDSLENDIMGRLFIDYFLSRIVKKHCNKVPDTLLAKHRDVILNLVEKKDFLFNKLGKSDIKKFRILQQYQECLESIYPSLFKH